MKQLGMNGENRTSLVDRVTAWVGDRVGGRGQSASLFRNSVVMLLRGGWMSPSPLGQSVGPIQKGKAKPSLPATEVTTVGSHSR